MQSKKYLCRNQTGRVFETYLEDVSALVMRNDGRFIDVYKNDETFPLLGESIKPAINVVHALVIKGEEDFTFYGNGIQINDINAEFQRLKMEVEQYKIAISTNTSAIEKKPAFALPKLPIIGLPPLPKIQITFGESSADKKEEEVKADLPAIEAKTSELDDLEQRKATR